MQSVSSRIWTRIAVFISYDDNHYTTGTSLHHGHLLRNGDIDGQKFTMVFLMRFCFLGSIPNEWSQPRRTIGRVSVQHYGLLEARNAAFNCLWNCSPIPVYVEYQVPVITHEREKLQISSRTQWLFTLDIESWRPKWKRKFSQSFQQ